MAEQREPYGLYVRTKSVDNTLKPLIRHVNSLVNHRSKHRDAGLSKNATILLSDVEEASNRFVSVGKTIAYENDDVREDLLSACDDVESSGSVMMRSSRSYLDDPCSKDKRDVMTGSAKELLTAVTRLLVIADIVDLNRVRRAARQVETRLQEIKQSATQSDVVTTYRNFTDDMANLSAVTGNRQQDIKDQRQAEKLAGARAQLMKYGRIVLTSSKAYVRYPEVASAKANRDFVVAQLCSALSSISATVAEEGASKPHPLEKPGGLASAIAQFKNIVNGIKETAQGMATKDARLQQSEVVSQTIGVLNEKMDRITQESTTLASAESTRSFRSEKIHGECLAVKEGLLGISEALQSQNHKLSATEHAHKISLLVDGVLQKTDNLHTQLRRAAVDHVSDLLYDVDVPLSVMSDAAKTMNRREMEDHARAFQDHCTRIEQASSRVTAMSARPDHVKMVKLAAGELRLLYPEVINAARTVAVQPTSKIARDNLEAFEEAWLRQAKLLTCAVDDAVDIDDFLAVSEIHILEELRQSVAAVQSADPDGMEQAASAVRGRVTRLCEVVLAEMQSYSDPKYSRYTGDIQQAVSDLQESHVPHFTSCIDSVLDQLSENAEALVDEREFQEVATAVRDGVRQVRDVVQSIRADAVANDPDAEIADEDLEPELPPPPPHLLNETEESEVTVLETETEREAETVTRGHAAAERPRRGYTSRQHSRAFIREDERELDQGELTRLPPEQIQEIQALKKEKQQLETEVERWDDGTNDLIVLAKDMGMMLVEMSDFTRGAGPLKSTMELISTAKEIAEAANAFDGLIHSVADQCPDQMSKNDVLAGLQRITFYSHQISITSKVKEDITTITGDSPQALENAITLITTAKNLMNAVVATVKSSYVASAKISKAAGNNSTPVIQWHFKAPSKVPLVRLESQRSMGQKSQLAYGTLAPLRALEDFHGRPPPPPVQESDEEML